MKTWLKLLPLLPAAAFGQSVPIMGTAPAQPAASAQAPAVHAPVAVTTQPPVSKHTQKRSAPVAAKPQGEILPPPSQVTRDFYQAFAQGNLPLADVLIQQGADINCRNCGQRTPIMLKVAQGSRDGMRWLIARGVDVNLPGSTYNGPTSPLMLATHGSLWAKEIMLTLLQAGADPNWQDIEGNTPFMNWAGRSFTPDYKIEILASMLGRGANVNATNKMGQTALMFAISGSTNCSPQAVQFLLGRGADASVKTVDGKTAATIAYQQALKGNTACNQVMAMLKSPPQPISDAPMPVNLPGGGQESSSPMGTGGVSAGQWQGVFNATSPRNASVGTTANIAPSGEVVFSSQGGMRGTGRLNVIGNRVSGSFAAPSPLDANGPDVPES